VKDDSPECRLSDHVASGRFIERPRDDQEYVGVTHRPGDVHRLAVNPFNEGGEFRTIPAGSVHEVVQWDADESTHVTGPYDGAGTASDAAIELATSTDLPIRDAIDRVTPDDQTRERRRQRGRWPPWRDESRALADAIPDDVPLSGGDHDIAVRISLHPDPDPPIDDDADPASFDDRYDVTVAHNAGDSYEVVCPIERDFGRREAAIEAAVRTAREREWPVFRMITRPPAPR